MKLNLPTHQSLPLSPTSFNPFILSIHPSTHSHSIDPSVLLFSHLPRLLSLSESQFFLFFVCNYVDIQWTASLFWAPPCFIFIQLHTATHLGAAQYHHSGLLLAPLQQLWIKSRAEGHLESSGCWQRDKALLIHFLCLHLWPWDLNKQTNSNKVSIFWYHIPASFFYNGHQRRLLCPHFSCSRLQIVPWKLVC